MQKEASPSKEQHNTKRGVLKVSEINEKLEKQTGKEFQTRIPADLTERTKDLAIKERRKMAPMIAILLEEALEARGV